MRLFYPSIHTRDRQHRLKQWKQKLSFFRTRHPSVGSKRFCPTKEWCQRCPSALELLFVDLFQFFMLLKGQNLGKDLVRVVRSVIIEFGYRLVLLAHVHFFVRILLSLVDQCTQLTQHFLQQNLLLSQRRFLLLQRV